VVSRTRLFSAPGADRVVLGHPRTSPHLTGPQANSRPIAWLDAATPAQRAALPRASGVRTLSSTSGNGIETVCPSPTLFSLGLGPTHPPWMNLPEEPLGIRRGGFFTSLALLMPAFALVVAPAPIPRDLPRSHDAPLPRLAAINSDQASAASVLDLSPATLSARPPPLTLSPDFGTLAGGPGCCPLDDESYHPPSHSHRLNALVFVVWLGLVSSRPLAHPELYPHDASLEAAPRCISGRTSYLQVRLAFHLYPQLIPPFCNTDGFGPPARVSGPSPWPWVAHLVSGLLHATLYALIRLAFAAAPGFQPLTSPRGVTRRLILQ